MVYERVARVFQLNPAGSLKDHFLLGAKIKMEKRLVKSDLNLTIGLRILSTLYLD